jgi:hypothetical protein
MKTINGVRSAKNGRPTYHNALKNNLTRKKSPPPPVDSAKATLAKHSMENNAATRIFI